jgi:hypothetical protein
MPPKKKTKKAAADEDSSSSDEPNRTSRGHAEVAGFFDENIPKSLYGVWRRNVAQLMRETGILGPQRAGTDRWSNLHWHAAALPTMAPRGMINYCADKGIIHAVNMLCQDIAKKLRNGE